ncbi:hypothetical protein P7K49_013930, partial [Saguinus oedipus]
QPTGPQLQSPLKDDLCFLQGAPMVTAVTGCSGAGGVKSFSVLSSPQACTLRNLCFGFSSLRAVAVSSVSVAIPSVEAAIARGLGRVRGRSCGLRARRAAPIVRGPAGKVEGNSDRQPRRLLLLQRERGPRGSRPHSCSPPGE